MLVSERYPYLEIVFAIGTGTFVESAYLDTGFEGGLLIPAYLQDEILGASVLSPLEIADGEIVYAPSWDGHVEVGPHKFRTEISALGRRFLLGRDVLDSLVVCFHSGKYVSVEIE
jgi:predicted aspartyl protease